MNRPRDGVRVFAWICMAVGILIAVGAVVYFGAVLILAILRPQP